MSHGRLFLIIAIAALLGFTGLARAATVSVGTGGSVRVEDVDDPAQDNTVTIDYGAGAWSVAEANPVSAPLVAGTGCTGTAALVTCAVASPLQAIVNDAGGINSYTMNANLPSLMTGGDGTDTLTGGPSSDTLHGGEGADTLNGGDGANILYGDGGPDTFTGGSGAGAFTVVNYDDAAMRSTGVVVTVGNGANDGEAADGGADTVTASVNGVTGTSRGDNITGGGTGRLVLRGEGGDDNLTAGSTTGDTLVGGPGIDVLTAGPGFDKLLYDYVGAGTPGLVAHIDSGGSIGTTDVDSYSGTFDELDGSVRNDTLTGSAGAEYLKGFGGDDTIDGLGGNDHLYGDNDLPSFVPASDNDTLTGGAGDDRLVGNEGNDTLRLDDGGADTLGGGSDCDGQLPPGGSAGTADVAYVDPGDAATTGCETVNLPGAATPTTTATAPKLNIPEAGLVGHHDVTLAGTAGDGAVSIDLYTRAADASHTLLKTVTATRSGSAFTVTTDLPDGFYDAVARQGSLSSETVTFRVDTAAPDLLIGIPSEGQQVSDSQPVLLGQAGNAPEDRATVTVLLSGPQGAGGAQDVQRQAAFWGLKWPTPLPAGHYTATVSQSDNLNHTTTKTVSFDLVNPSPIPFPTSALVPTQAVRAVPSVAGKPLATARTLLAQQTGFVDIDYDFVRGADNHCADNSVGLVRQQSPAPGPVVNSVDHPTPVTLQVCISGDDDVLKGCDLSQLRSDLKHLDLKTADYEITAAFLREGKKCQDDYDVRLKASQKPGAEPVIGAKTVNKPGKRRDEIHSQVDCPRDPAAQDLHLFLSDGTNTSNRTFYGFKAEGAQGWTLPDNGKSAFKLLVTGLDEHPVQADVYVDPDDVAPAEFGKRYTHVDEAGSEVFFIAPSQPGLIKICAVMAAPDPAAPALYGTAELRVVPGPKTNEPYKTTNGRTLIVRPQERSPEFVTRSAPLAHTSNVFNDLWNGIVSFFSGKSQTVNAAKGADDKKLATVHEKAGINPAQVNTCGGALDNAPKPPVVRTGTVFGQLDGQIFVGQAQVVGPAGGSCGPALVGVQSLSAAEGKTAGLITNDGGSLITNDGGSIVAQGAGNIVAQGAGNLITNDGGSLITNDGGSIISNDGASIVAAGAGNLVADKSALITNDGGSLVSGPLP